MEKNSFTPSERISELFHPAMLCYSLLMIEDDPISLDTLVKKIKSYPNQSGYDVHFTDKDISLFGKTKFSERGISEFIEIDKNQLVEGALGLESCFKIEDEMVSLVSDYEPDLDTTFNLFAKVTKPIESDTEYDFLSMFHSKTLNSNVVSNIDEVNNNPIELSFEFDPMPELLLVMLFGKKETTRISIPELMDDLFNEKVFIRGQQKCFGECVESLPNIIKRCPCLRVTQRELILTPPVIWKSKAYGELSLIPFHPLNNYVYKKADATSVPKSGAPEHGEPKKRVQKEELDIKNILDRFKKGQRDVEFTLAELFDYIKGELAIMGRVDVWDKETEDKVARQVRTYLFDIVVVRKGPESPQYDEAFDKEYFSYIAEKFSRDDPVYHEYLQRYEKSVFEEMADSNDIYAFKDFL